MEAEFLGFVEGGATVTEALDYVLWQVTGTSTLPAEPEETEEPVRSFFLQDAVGDGDADLQALASA